MVLIGVRPLLTNTMGIETTDFILLVKNSGDRMQMLSGRRNDLIDSYTREEIKVEFIFNCLYAKSKNLRITEAHDIMATECSRIHLQDIRSK